MIGLNDTDVDLIKWQMTGEHFVDAAGVAWPEGSFAVIQQCGNPFCILVSPKLKSNQ